MTAVLKFLLGGSKCLWEKENPLLALKFTGVPATEEKIWCQLLSFNFKKSPDLTGKEALWCPLNQ